jgi:hypothetical protein
VDWVRVVARAGREVAAVEREPRRELRLPLTRADLRRSLTRALLRAEPLVEAAVVAAVEVVEVVVELPRPQREPLPVAVSTWLLSTMPQPSLLSAVVGEVVDNRTRKAAD